MMPSPSSLWDRRTFEGICVCACSDRWERPNWCANLKKDLFYGTPEKQRAMAAGEIVGDPDDDDRSKARAVIQWGRWLMWLLRNFKMLDTFSPAFRGGFAMNIKEVCFETRPGSIHGSMSISSPCDVTDSLLCTQVLFFIDWPCVDQENPVPEIAALPAYASACSGILSFYTPEYQSRAWCRVELLMSHAFAVKP